MPAISALLTHRPLALANALDKLQNYRAPNKELKTKYADSMIVNHFQDKYFVERMLRTHPPMDKRIKRLKELDAKMRKEGIDTSIKDPFVSERMEATIGDRVNSEEFSKALSEACDNLMGEIRSIFLDTLDIDVKMARGILAKASSDPSMAILASMIYYYGYRKMVAVSYDKAFDFASYAANNGEEMSFMFLGCLYAMGRGTETDVHKALYWLDRSKQTKYRTELTITLDGRTLEL